MIQASYFLGIDISKDTFDVFDFRTGHEELKQLEELLECLIKEHAQETYTNLLSIPGIGKKTALLSISSTNAFETFDHPKQLIAFFGLAPVERSSGSSIRGKTSAGASL